MQPEHCVCKTDKWQDSVCKGISRIDFMKSIKDTNFLRIESEDSTSVIPNPTTGHVLSQFHSPPVLTICYFNVHLLPGPPSG